MSKKSTTKFLIDTATGLMANEKLQRTLFGEYSDGTPRSLSDCLDGEILSPKDREKMLYKGKRKLKSGNKKQSSKSKNKKSKSKGKQKRKVGKIDLEP